MRGETIDGALGARIRAGDLGAADELAGRALSLLERARPTLKLTEDLHPVEDGRLQENAEVIDALAHLAPDRRVVVVLRVVLGFTPQECADALGVAVGTVHSRLHRALADLRGVLEVPSA